MWLSCEKRFCVFLAAHNNRAFFIIIIIMPIKLLKIDGCCVNVYFGLFNIDPSTLQ